MMFKDTVYFYLADNVFIEHNFKTESFQVSTSFFHLFPSAPNGRRFSSPQLVRNAHSMTICDSLGTLPCFSASPT
ncbi:unnamed protein product [Caenorhabditis nigoni]